MERVTRPALLSAAALGVLVASKYHKKLGIWLACKGKPMYVLKSEAGVEVHISPVGCVIQKLLVPDANGKTEDIVLGFDDLEPYTDGRSPYFGAVVGRCANRIANGRFTIDGKMYQLAINNGPNALHGGLRGFDKRVWRAQRVEHPEGEALRLTRTSPDGEEGYPGQLEASVTYVLLPQGVLRVIMEATTDGPTPVNLVQHTSFNLAGHASGSALGHQLTIAGDRMSPVDEVQVPTGEIVPVEGTPFDFLSPHSLGERIGRTGGGYDHNYVLHPSTGTKPRLAATVREPTSGRCMAVLTTAPGLQLYSGNFLGGERGKGGAVYQKHSGFCLETQGFPNAVNQPNFPSVVLRPGEKYYHEVVYHFTHL